MSAMKLITVTLAALFLAVVSMVLRSSELSVMYVAILAVPVISYALGRLSAYGLRCTREMPGCVHEGEPIDVRLRLRGRNLLPVMMELRDHLPEGIEMDAREERSSDDESSRAMLISYRARASKRGEYEIGPPVLSTSDPLGFFRFKCEYPLTSSLLVLPGSLPVAGLRIWSAGDFGEHQFEGTGARGGGTDFHGVREYQAGDELRRVHWPSSARHGRLNVIDLQHSRSHDTVIALELHQGSEIGKGQYSTLEYSVRIAAYIAEQSLRAGSMTRLLGSGIEGHANEPRRGREHLLSILHALARVKSDQEDSLAEMLLANLDSITPGSAVVCLAPSLDEGLGYCAEVLSPRGILLHIILTVAGDQPTEEVHETAAKLSSLGASVTLMDCSTDRIEAHVAYHYGIS